MSEPIAECSQVLSVVVRVYGTQDSSVRAAINSGPNDIGYVAVTVGATLTYCYDLAAVISFANAFAEASARPIQWLPETTQSFPLADGTRVIVQTSATGEQPTEIRLIAAAASRDGNAHLVARIGRTTTVIFDRAALDSYRSAWGHALTYAQRIFTNPNPDAFDELEAKAREREALHFERTGQLPDVR
jgi:hypothetical protein